MESHFLIPDWPVPPSVKAAVTLRSGGGSKVPYDSNNLAMHVGDSKKDVIDNRTRLKETLALPSAPCWLDQYHSTEVIDAAAAHGTPRADASVSRQAGTVCAVLTADCLPVLLCNRQGNQVAAAHAGWRGLCEASCAKQSLLLIMHPPTSSPTSGPQSVPKSLKWAPKCSMHSSPTVRAKATNRPYAQPLMQQHQRAGNTSPTSTNSPVPS